MSKAPSNLFVILLTLDSIITRRLCYCKIILATPSIGIKSVASNAFPGDTIMLSAGSFSGPENCGLEFSVNTTLQGVTGQTSISCDGKCNILGMCHSAPTHH